MFQRILLPVDNSRYSEFSLDLAIALAQKGPGVVVGFHVYAAQLHRGRFQQLETSLPPKYREPSAMEKQRQAHASLIHQGLDIISRSYLEACAARCQERGVAFEEKVAEGKHYVELVKEASSGYQLVVLGAKGLGEEEDQPVGSVCLRAVRRLVDVDALVVKDAAALGGPIVAALDGSPCSRRGFSLALELAKAFGGEVEAVAAYDPDFHERVFKNLVEVLSDEAGKLFRVEEQEQLHRDVIDQGMARLCQEHLDWAQQRAAQEGVSFRGELLKGKPATTLARHARKRHPCLIVAGRVGAHKGDWLDLGGTAEALLLLANSNLLIAAGGTPWKEDARARLERIPKGIMRDLTQQRVEELARHRGEHTVTRELVEAKYAMWAEGSASAQSELPWTEEARARIGRAPAFIRAKVTQAVEDYARLKGAAEVTSDLVDEAKARWEGTGIVHR